MYTTVLDDFIVASGGMKRVSTLTPGVDKVIEYKTNRPLHIRKVQRVEIGLLKVSMSDGTDALILQSDYTQDPIPIYPVDFQTTVLPSSMYSFDPYSVGALLAYGDYSDEYVNLPGFYPYVNQYIARVNGWLTAEKIGNNGQYYFTHSHSFDSLVRWEEFLDGMMCSAVDNMEPIFPVQFATGSFRVRRQLLSGVFDVGYTDEPFDNRLQISNKDEERLIAIQEILKSLGILSRISLYNDVYILTVTGDYDNTTGLFYNIEYMENMVRNNNWNMERDGTQLKIEKVIKEIPFALVWVPVFEDDQPHTYIDSNFLGRRTIPV